MIAQPLSSTESSSFLRKFVVLLLLAFYLLTAAPEALAQCTVTTDGSGSGVVVFESCTEAKNPNNVNTLTLAYPPVINSGDLLVISIATDGNENFFVPSGWEGLVDINNGGSNLAVMKRIADGTETGNITLSWTSNEEVIAVMMRFTGTTGATAVATNTGNSNTPQAPTINPGFANYLALRLGAYDDDDVNINPGTVMAGHSNINQDESGGGGGTVSASAAYLAFAGGGASGTGNFSLTASEGWSTATVAIEFGAASPPTPVGEVCPRFDGTVTGSQLVVLQECVEQKQGTNVGSTTVSAPIGAVEGNYMLALIATDGAPAITEPGTWTVISEGASGGAVTYGIYERFVTAAEPANYTWTLDNNERMYSNILVFSDASGSIVTGFSNGTSNSPTSPSINTLADNSLVVRAAAQDDDDLQRDPLEIITGQTNISADASSSLGGQTTSGQSVYLNQAATGATGTAVFSMLASEQWRAATIAVEPIEFRFSMPDLTASTCGAQLVTLSVTDRNGNPVTTFRGTVSLSASNSASATWSGGGAGASDIVDLSGGNATYEFVSGDNGVAVFEYHNPVANSVNFDLSYDANGPVFSENGSFDPTLIVDNNCAFQIALDDGSMGTCNAEQMTISLLDSEAALATHYTGTITVDSGGDGNYVAIGASNSVVNGTLDDGIAQYTFDLNDGGQLVLSYTDATADVLNVGVTDSTYTAALSANLTIGQCRIVISHSGNSDVCSLAPVNIAIRDETNGLVSNFTGTITLSDGAVAGAWTVDTATNALVDNGGGSVDYTFAVGDGGDIDLFYELDSQTAIVDFDATTASFGIASPSGAEDPMLDVSSCTPAAAAQACLAGTSTSIAIGAQNPNPALRGRMVLLAVGLEGLNDVTSALFDGAPMTLLYEELNLNGLGNITELWGILDTDLPATAGTYNGSFVTADPDPSMCLLYLTDVEQAFFAPTSGATGADRANGSQAQNTQDAVTAITTTADNALVISLVGNGSGGSDYPAATSVPDISMTELFDAPDPGGGAEFEASSGIMPTAGSITVTDSWTAAPNRHSHVVASFNPVPIPVDPTEIRLAHSTESDVCSLEAITISVTDALGTPATNFEGTITITNSVGAGSWSVNTATNALVDNGGGSVDYTFDLADGGEIVLYYELNQTATVDFNVTTATPGITSPSGANDPILDVAVCYSRISVAPQANVCSASETVTLTILDRDFAVPAIPGSYGSVTLTASSFKGDFISTDGNPANLSNGGPDDGVAAYLFDGTEGASVDFEYSTSTVGALTITAAAPYITFDAAGSAEDLEVLDCEFRISFDGGASGANANSDVCSLPAMTIEVWNVDGGSSAIVSDYVGTVNINTTSGSWFEQGGGSPGVLTDGPPQDGAATYEFVVGDAGAVTLDFATNTSGTLNFSVTQGAISADNTSWDPDLIIALCTFRITMVDETMTACTTEDITITAYDSSNAPATNYTGIVSISTSTLHGNWSGTGVVDTPGDDNGVATAEITAGGTTTITFEDFNFEDVNVNLVAGEMVEDGAFDPILEVTGCLPSIVNSVCFPGSGGGTGSLPLSASPGPGRMVVMWVFHADDPSPQTVTGTTFDSAPMTELIQQNAANTGVSMWGILDADLPAGGSSYAGAYTFNAPPANTASMCMAELSNVDQSFGSVVVGSNAFGTTGDLSTSISTGANNALVLSGAASDYTAGNSWFNDVEPDPPMVMLFTGNNDQNPVNGTGGGSQGIKPTAGLISVNDIDNQAATTSAAHIVASFNPLVAGDPEVEGYVPVLLHETLSGNISYRAIGKSLRTHSNSATSPDTNGECSFVPIGTGTTATLAMPTGSTVERAYLYWAGSGTEAQSDLDIEFGHSADLPSLNSITGEELFMIEGVGSGGDLDYFASYKEVTSEVAANGNGDYTFRQLSVQNGAPWAGGATACAGGWGLVVVYSNVAEAFRVANLFHGFQPFQNSSFTLVPRNFRMKTTDNDPALFEPNGQITHITVEGDETLVGGAGDGEALGMQDDIGSDVFNVLTNSYNPATGDFNSTVTRPSFFLDNGPGGTNLYQFDATGGDDGAGYENDADIPDHPDLLPYSPSDVREQGDSWGFDIDTHYLSGNDNTGELWNFAQPDAEAEQITTQYSSGQDLVLLLSEIISVTNFDLADLEVFKTVSGELKVNQPQDYLVTVTNNGNNGSSGGEATGLVVVADILPNGMTLNSVSGSDWTCYTGADRYSCTFDILNDCVDYGTGSDDIGCETVLNQLSTGESLPDLTVNVQVGGFAFFPDQVNPTKNVARLQHNGANAPAEPACIALISGSPGILPDPDDCQRSPQFDNKNDLDGGAIDINDIDDKGGENNNVDSIIANVIGLRTDLGIDKVIDGPLEVGESQSYTITIINNGPDDTDEDIRLQDTAPAGIQFAFVEPAGWVCATNTVAEIDCTYAAPLLSSNSLIVPLDVNVTGAAGLSVTNTAQVTPGLHNFDTINTSNNTDSDTTVIIAPPVASQEEFLISVSVAGNATTIGGFGPFQNDDYMNYNPQTDIGTGFYDDSATGDVKDANAVHVFKNGHIAISAAGPATSTVGGLAFEPEDVVVYDPILDTATMLFDGSAIFNGPIGTEHSIDAVYVKETGEIVFSILGDENPATDDDVCILAVCFSEADVVQYNPNTSAVTILIDGYDSTDGDDEIFTSEAQVNGIYIRVDDTDPDDVKEVYVLSVNGTVQVGACASCDPVGGTGVTPDDIIEVDLTGANPVTENLFLGNVPFGQFTPTSGTREIDAIHVKEDGYHGHFAISQAQVGTTCEAGQITIRKHEFDHSVDTDYAGSIFITTDDGTDETGRWSIADGDGSLSVVDLGGGVLKARYTFVPSDMGEVTLYISQADPITIDVDVTNGLVDEQEDPAFNFANVVTDISYKDEFTAAAFDNNDGIALWKNSWTEVDNAAADTGVSNGNVLIAAGSMQFTTEPGNTSAEMSRDADLSLVFPISDDLVELSFDYKYSSLNGGADRFVAEVRESDSDGWEEVWFFDTGGSNGTFQSSGKIDLAAAIGGSFTAWSDSTEIRFRVDTGYTGTSRMFIDNVLLETGTTQCFTVGMDHWEIRIENATGNSAFEVGGISCLASRITITGHDAVHAPTAPEEAISIRALSETGFEKGTWSAPTSGSGSWVDSGTNTDGVSTYTFPIGENSVELNFNYTEPTLSPERINFNLTSLFPVHVTHDPTLVMRDVIMRLYNETSDSVNDIGTQIAGKASNVAAPTADVFTVQVLTNDSGDTTLCVPLIDVGETLDFDFALECIDSDTCTTPTLGSPVATVNGVEIPDVDSDGGSGASSYGEVPLTFANYPNSGVAAPIVLMYEDAGNVQLHAQFDPPINITADNDTLPMPITPDTTIDTPIETFSNVFTVRPFGVAIDFPLGTAGSEGRDTNGLADFSYSLDAAGTSFAVAGDGFNTRVQGIRYQPADDVADGAGDAVIDGLPDGIPDTDSELWDNLVTPNFGADATAAADYKVRISSTTVAPAGGYGVLTGTDFGTFTSGAQTHTMTFDEVGIIDLEAELLQPDNNPATYLLSGTQLTGHVRNVGRFYPATFELSSGSILSRVQASMEAMCINPTSAFTYLGEDFQISAVLEAQNSAGVRTRNYVGSGLASEDFAKLEASDMPVGSFFIFEELPGADNDLSTRRALGSSPPDMTWPTAADLEAERGIGLLSGNLVFNRQADGSEDGPHLGLSVGLDTSDVDGASLELGIDIDETPPNDAALIATEDFRYGRLMIDNAFGPETEDLAIPFRIEYWTGSDWATNTLDSCTILTYNATEDTASLRSAFYVDDSWEGALDGDADGQDDGETVIENDAVIADSDIVISLSAGLTGESSGVDDDLDNQDDDRPLSTSAPGEGFDGSVLVEFDLNNGSLPYPLDFLSYDWRTTVEVDVLDEIEDGNYIDNPRGQVSFGSYRGHDRVINWQEIYIGPTP